VEEKAMTIIAHHHLAKLNNLHNRGAKLHLLQMLTVHALRYGIMRPTLARLALAGRYRHENKLFYTVLTGNYDRLHPIRRQLPNWRYVCFTDNPGLHCDGWEIRQIANPDGLDPGRLSRLYKIKHHLVDQGWSISVYADANLAIRGDLDAFLAQALAPGSPLAIPFHPFLFSLRQEVEQCIVLGKDSEELLRAQYRHYTEEMGFSDPFPHINARLLIRRTGDPEVVRLMDAWYHQLHQWSRRDQVAFNYALSLCRKVEINYIPYWLFRRYFKRLDHR